MGLKQYFEKIKKCRYCSYKSNSNIPAIVEKEMLEHIQKKHPDKRIYKL